MSTFLGQLKLKICKYTARFEMEVEAYLDVGYVLCDEVGAVHSDDVLVVFFSDH